MTTPSHSFGIGMKLEAVDKRNPASPCVATIKDCIGDYVLIHFDGWVAGFDQWVHVSSELLHYAGYSEEHNQALSIPIGKCWKKCNRSLIKIFDEDLKLIYSLIGYF